MIREIITLLIILLFGHQNRPKNDLRKKPTTRENWLQTLIQRYYIYILAFIIVLCFILFVYICFAICGVSATESGAVYNNFDKVI